MCMSMWRPEDVVGLPLSPELELHVIVSYSVCRKPNPGPLKE